MMEITTQVHEGDGESWKTRTLIRCKDPNFIANLRQAITVDLYEPAETIEDWEKKEDARDTVNTVLSLAGVRPYGNGRPGNRFSDRPYIFAVNDRIMVIQTGGIDV